MISVPINLIERIGVARRYEPITMGVPFSQGTLKELPPFCLVDRNGGRFPVQAKITATWPDDSVRWILIDFQISLESNESKTLALQADTFDSSIRLPIVTDESEQQIHIDTGKVRLCVNKLNFKPFESVIIEEKEVVQSDQCDITLVDQSGTVFRPVVREITTESGNQDLKVALKVKGDFESSGGDSFASFSSCMTFYAGHSFFKWDFSVTNPRAAKHPGGLWDLGDSGSIFFKELAVSFALCGDEKVWWKERRDEAWKRESNGVFSIFQAASGGKNWKGNIHKNYMGEVPLKFNGYLCQSNDKKIASGNRASPYVHLENTGGGITAYISQFWQNFPKSIEVREGKLFLQLFSRHFSDVFELQGGERKTHTLYIDFANTKDTLDWLQAPIVPRLPLDWHLASGSFSYLTNTAKDGEFDALIKAGAEGESSFFQKREIVDEYGWRNFGELYADHEALGHKGEQPLVSHYNNQYDPIYGFARQFVVSGNPLWFELMDDLARHVTDIDIYHTHDDRETYNEGLFWHTNHYLDACTSTHRTFSKGHPDVTPDGPSGGGPGNEHCYTSGLLFHYYLTGSTASKEAVLTLSQWILTLNKDPVSVLGKLQALKNKGLLLVKKVLRGGKVYKHRYPLTRGTGNIISTLLDAYLLTGDGIYIQRVEKVIKQTVHPCDNIQDRGFDDIELTWSYTVFLQSVAKYLEIKIDMKEMDASFRYARDSLLVYAQWMMIHETPYLDRSEALIYPNLTWVAQDIRKANIFCFAYKFSGGTDDAYLEKARYYYEYIKRELNDHDESAFTRILVILMQNHGPHVYFKEKHQFERYRTIEQVNYGTVQFHSMGSLLTLFFVEFFRCMKNFSLSAEIKWLKHRL